MKSAKEILLDAANVIERGWYQGDFAGYHDDNDKTLCHCALGTISVAEGRGGYGDPITIEGRKAERRLEAYIERSAWPMVQFLTIPEWNDQPSQTASNVANTMRIVSELIDAGGHDDE